MGFCSCFSPALYEKAIVKRTNQKKVFHKKRYQKVRPIIGVIITSLIVLLIVFFYIFSKSAIFGRSTRACLSASNESVQWDTPAHFTFKGETYIYKCTSSELPDGYNYAGKTTSDLFSESNIDGVVYIDDKNPDDAYFQWTDWNESVDGPEPYLYFTIEQ